MSEAILPDIIIGVDTHKHTHAAVAITRHGARVGELTIEVNMGGYRELETWTRLLGAVRAMLGGKATALPMAGTSEAEMIR